MNVRTTTAAALLAGATVLAALSAQATTWYFAGDTSLSTPLNDSVGAVRGVINPAAWVDGSGNRATAFNADDTYILRNNAQLRLTTPSGTTGDTFAGGLLQVGDTAVSGNNRIGHPNLDGNETSFPNGISFVFGYFRVSYSQYNVIALRDTVLHADAGISVLSSDSDPFSIFCRADQTDSSKFSNRRLLIDAPFSSESDAALAIGSYAASHGTNFTVAITGDCSDYEGKIVVRTALTTVPFGEWDTCLMLGDTTVDGTIQVNARTAIEARKGVNTHYTYQSADVAECTVGTLELAANSVIVVSGDTTTPTNGIIHARDSLSVTAPVAVNVKYDPRIPSTNKVTILTAPASSNLDASDFVLRLDTFIPASHYSLAVENDGVTKSLVATFEPMVRQISNYANESTKEKAIGSFPEGYSSLTNAAAWSDGLVPSDTHAPAHYFSEKNLRTLVAQSSDYDFPGLSFTKAGSQLTLFTKSFRVPEFTAFGNPVIWTGAWTDSTIVADTFNAVSGTIDLGAYCDKTLTIDAEIVGAADLLLHGVSSTSASQGNYVLTGLNTNFTGNITVAHREQKDGRWDFGTHFQTLYVNDGRNLGGAKETFDANALTIKDMARLAVTNADVTLAAGLNRGLCIEGIGRIYVQEPGALTVNWPRRIHGTMFKEGNGTLALGGDGAHADVYIDGGQSADATNRLFVVTNGYVKALSAGCVDGLTVSLAANATTGLKLDYTTADAELAQFGFKNVATDTPFEGTIDVIIENYSREAYDAVKRRKLGLITVKTTAADGVASSLNLHRDGLGSVAIERADDAGTGYTTFSAVFSPGLTIVFR